MGLKVGLKSTTMVNGEQYVMTIGIEVTLALSVEVLASEML